MIDTPTILNQERVGSVLTHLGIRWLRSADGTLVAQFRPDRSGPLVTASYRVEGDEDQVLAVRAVTEAVYDPDDWPRLVGALNAWHSSHRWPVASLVESELEGQVVAAVDVFLPAGATDSQLAALLSMATGNVVDFHLWLARRHQEAGSSGDDTPSVEELERWFHGIE